MSWEMAAAAVASTAAAAAYLDAKYHIRKDLRVLKDRRDIMQMAVKASKEDRLSLWYMFEDQANALLDDECLWYRAQPSDPVTRYTWRQTHEQSCRYAQFMLQNGVQSRELMCMYLINSPELIFVLLGTWALGTAPAMINYNLSGKALIHSLRIGGGKLLLVDEDDACRQRIEEVRSEIENDLGMKIVVLDSATRASIASMEPVRPGDEFRSGLPPRFPVALFYTSGTTGYPKAAGLPTIGASGLGILQKSTTGLKTGDVWYDCMPMYHGTGAIIAIGALVSGTRLAIGRKFSVRNFWQDVHDSDASAFVYVGEMARYLLAAPPSPLDKDHHIKAIYGNGMRPDIWRRFMDRFNIPSVNEFFTSTEAMLALLNVCKSPFHDASVGHHGVLQRYLNKDRLVPVRIDYENGDEIWRNPKTGFAERKPYEEGGEILIACNTQDDFKGYWKNQEATDKRFVRDVFKKGDLYYRSGDALRRDGDGHWYFQDRLGDTFRWKSENVSTAEVAEVFGGYPQVVETNVYGVEIPNHDGRAGCAAIYIPQEDRRSFDWQGLLQHAQKGLPKYAVPLFLRLVQSPSPMHNNKQTKGPFRKEGVNPKTIAEGEAGNGDELMWLPPGGDRYVPFEQTDWEAISAGKARL